MKLRNQLVSKQNPQIQHHTHTHRVTDLCIYFSIYSHMSMCIGTSWSCTHADKVESYEKESKQN